MLDECQDDRKLRLFACACARRVLHLMPDKNKIFLDAIELGEQLAEGKVTETKRKSLKDKCEKANERMRSAARAAAFNCLSSDASSAAWNGAWAAAAAEPGKYEGKAWKAARAKQADLLREIFGNPLAPVRVEPAWLKWSRRTVPQMAERIYRKQSFTDLPVLADALEDAGCTNSEILSHLRSAQEHVRGCWVLDLLRDGHS
jgi:hypothetical protein